MENSHINESILSEEILEDQKKNRIDHMTYLPGMEDIGSDVMDQVISAMNAYDYEKYTEADLRRAIAHDIRTPNISLHFSHLPHFLFLRRSHRLQRQRHENISETASTCLLRSTLQTTAKTIVFTVVSTATTRSTVHS